MRMGQSPYKGKTRSIKVIQGQKLEEMRDVPCRT